MRNFLIRLLKDYIYQPESLDVQKMKDWLYASYEHDGFKNYYTMRKRSLVNFLLLDLTDKERQKAQGRLEELRGLSTNIREEYKRRAKKKENLNT